MCRGQDTRSSISIPISLTPQKLSMVFPWERNGHRGPTKRTVARNGAQEYYLPPSLTLRAGGGSARYSPRYDKSFPKRIYTFTEPSYNLFQDSKYPELQANAIVQAQQAGRVV